MTSVYLENRSPLIGHDDRLNPVQLIKSLLGDKSFVRFEDYLSMFIVLRML